MIIKIGYGDYLAKTKAEYLKECQFIAKDKNGKCLSKEYVNSKTKLKWICSKKHTWEAAPSNIKSGKWCPRCSGVGRFTISDLKEFAKKKGGKCLSENYSNGWEKLKWQCREGHTWDAKWNHIKNSNSWCPYCSGNKGDFLSDAKKIARERGGKLISTKYVKSSAKLKWQCANGHSFNLSLSNAKTGQWCNICSSGISERICRAYIEALTGKRFPKKNPEWLKNRHGDRLELDGYNEKLQMAFEHQGIQHYKEIHFFHTGTATSLKKQRENDFDKKKACKKQGVYLIEIPQIGKMLKVEELREFLIKIISKKSSSLLVKKSKNKKISLRKAYSNHQDIEHFETLSRIALENNGRLISEDYFGDNTKLEWICENNHIWKATPTHIKQGKWCPKCSVVKRAEKRLSKTNIADLNNLAKSKGGACLSKKYLGVKHKHLWQCPKGHKWEALVGSIKQGRWCAECSGRNKTIETLKSHAESLVGKCLSKSYSGVKEKYKWKCEQGHRWESTADSVLNKGTWCPECGKIKKAQSRLNKTSIKDLQKLATSRGGKFLSDKYLGGKHKHKWKCKKNHIWEAVVDSIKAGSWCPVCGIEKRASSQRLSIEEMQKIAKERGGACLSKCYKNGNQKLKWKCKEEHVWMASSANVKSGKWCKICGNKRAGLKKRLTIEEMQQIAEKRKGRCLSKKYQDSHSNLKWKCESGHIWEAVPSSIKSGTWCPTCANKKSGSTQRLTIEDARKLAKKSKGFCLSKEYKNAHTKMNWKCKKGHTWQATFNSIQSGSWCPFCANSTSRKKSKK